MRIPIILLVASLALVSLAGAAEADHRCYTFGHYQVCRHIPGDEVVEEVVDELKDPDGCIRHDAGDVCI